MKSFYSYCEEYPVFEEIFIYLNTLKTTMKQKGFQLAHEFDWGLYPKAEQFLNNQIKKFLKNNAYAKRLAAKMQKQCSTEIFDWVDYITLPNNKATEKRLKQVGFKEVKRETPKQTTVYQHTKSILPPVLLHNNKTIELALKPEFLKRKTDAPFRKAILKQQGKYILTAVERRGYNGFIIKKPTDLKQYKKALNNFKKRKRKFATDREGMLYTIKLVKKTLKSLNPGRTADAFFRAERLYWQSRNKAGRVQHKRQNTLGLGWGNHDHHTYRSSRENFKLLVHLFEVMGYECREEFYAGEKAGWGAQILEHPECNIVIFSDVDITKEERNKDFAHKGLKPIKKFGTVGLWIALHGESILQAGMHHLEARFKFEQLEKDLKKKGVKMMNPFSHFPFLKQAFTQGERWKVEKKRLLSLLKKKQITKEQYTVFSKEGAIGSHMENLQRRQGFKGFNQDSVSVIIKETDPRTQRGA